MRPPRAAVTGALTAIPHIHVLPTLPGKSLAASLDEHLPDPMVVHVRDVATAEISLMVGTREIVYQDPQLVAGLLEAVRQAGGGR